MKQILLFLLLIGLIFVIGPIQSHAQNHAHATGWENELHTAFLKGKITLDERIRYALYAGLKPSQLPTQWKPDRHKSPSQTPLIRCLTPTLHLYQANKSKLLKSTQSEASTLLSADLDSKYTSPSGIFEIKYTTSGDHAVPTEDADQSGIPDYVENTATYADSSYRHQVSRLGFTDPILGSQKYEIRLQDVGGLYGYTETVSSTNGRTTAIVVHHTFDNFPSNSDPEGNVIGALKVTVAHEFKHAIQYAANNWAGESDEWAEMDATLMEEVTFDDVNDYYNYNTSQYSIFSDPTTTLYPGSYYHASWAIYYAEVYGASFWVDVWKNIKTGMALLPAVDQELANYGTSFEHSFTENYVWHYATGPNRSPADFGFPERQNYPESSLTNQTNKIPDTPFESTVITRLSGNFYSVIPESGASGDVYAWLSYETPLSLGILSYNENNTAEQSIFFANPSGYTLAKLSNTDWSNLKRLGVVVTNPDYSQPNSGSYYPFQVGVGSASNIEHLWIGDYDKSNQLTESDITGLQTALLIGSPFNSTQQLNLDVTGDGTVSDYDAALILKYLNDSQSAVPIDYNGNGKAPDPERFTVTGEDGFNYTPPSISGDALFSALQENTETYQNKLSVNLSLNNQSTGDVHSARFTIRIPADTLNFQQFILDDTISDNALVSTRSDGDTLHISLLSDVPLPDGQLGSLEFAKEKLGTVTLNFTPPFVNEWDGHAQFTSTTLTHNHESQKSRNLPEQTQLLGNYPNPFNPTTVIRYQLRRPSSVTLQIYDLNGRLIQTLANNKTKNAGEHRISFNARQLSTGVYLYRLTTDESTFTEKMLYLK